MKENTKEALKKDLEENKQLLIKTFDEKVLPNVHTTKEELENFRAKHKGATEEQMKYAEQELNVMKKINVIAREANLFANLDNAIEFLDYLIKQSNIQ
jgi:hypothetical protein